MIKKHQKTRVFYAFFCKYFLTKLISIDAYMNISRRFKCLRFILFIWVKCSEVLGLSETCDYFRGTAGVTDDEDCEYEY